MNVSAFLLIESSKVRRYQRFRSLRIEKCECISVFAHRELKRAKAFSLIEKSKVRMYQRFCSSRNQKCECINVFAHRELKSANVNSNASANTNANTNANTHKDNDITSIPKHPPLQKRFQDYRHACKVQAVSKS